MRDHFAVQAVVSLLQVFKMTPFDPTKEEYRDERLLWGAVAKDAYSIADAMLAAREAKP